MIPIQALLSNINKALPLPIDFDQNEVFILLNLLGFLWVIFLTKRFALVIKILILLYGMCIPKIIDHAIAGPPLDLYDIGDQPLYELFDELGYLMYTPYAYLFTYLFDKYQPKRIWFTAYIVCMSLFGIGFEWVAVKCHVFTYKGWSLLYSFPVYLMASLLHLKLFMLLKKTVRQSKEKLTSNN